MAMVGTSVVLAALAGDWATVRGDILMMTASPSFMAAAVMLNTSACGRDTVGVSAAFRFASEGAYFPLPQAITEPSWLDSVASDSPCRY
jgi:hypothetical protein